MFDHRGRFVSPTIPESGQLFLNFVTLYYDAENVMDDNNYSTVLDSNVTTSSMQVVKVHTKKVPGLDHLVLAKRGGISPKKAMNMIRQTTQSGIHTILHPSL